MFSNVGRTRPWFVYGSLKPGELGYRRIETLVAESFPAQLDDWQLGLRDGLPAIKEKPSSAVKGFVLEAKPDEADALDTEISSFEYPITQNPRTYKESIATVTTPDGQKLAVKVNAANHPNKSPLETISSGTWSVSDDLLFRHALPVLYDQAHQTEDVYPDSDIPEFWKTYMPLKGTFLNLWTVFERYVAFAQPALQNLPTEDRGDREECECKAGPKMTDHYLALHESDLGTRLLEYVQTLPKERIYLSNKVKRSARTHVPWEQWYTVRNNAAHRGKTAIKDFRIVHNAARGLSEALIALIRLEVPALDEHYESLGIPLHAA